MQACDIDLEHEVSEVTQTAPCIIQIGITGVESAQFFVACEQEVRGSPSH